MKKKIIKMTSIVQRKKVPTFENVFTGSFFSTKILSLISLKPCAFALQKKVTHSQSCFTNKIYT